MAFWFFIAAVVVAGIWYDIRKKESQQETIRRLFESGQKVDEKIIDKLMASTSDSADRIDRGLDLHTIQGTWTQAWTRIFNTQLVTTAQLLDVDEEMNRCAVGSTEWLRLKGKYDLLVRRLFELGRNG